LVLRLPRASTACPKKDFGASRWQLVIEGYNNFPLLRKRGANDERQHGRPADRTLFELNTPFG
jgi:hypothetical protein